ncbi:undecaprenyl-phosphate glucose phosphotransferase [Urechidicola sp. KH5]
MKYRYSTYLKPLSIIIDVIVLNAIALIYSRELFFDYSYLLYINFGWLIISGYTKFYQVYRYTKLTRVVSKLLVQFGLFFFIYFSYFTLFKEGSSVGNQFYFLSISFALITFFKLIKVYVLRRYRVFGGNYREVVILGGSSAVNSLKELFKERRYLGYRFKGFFSNKEKHKSKAEYLGTIMDSFEYVMENSIDEIYCSIEDFKRKDLNTIIEFGEKHNISVKLIPSTMGMFRNGMEVQYYDYVPVLSFKKLPFDDPIIKYSKRAFDVLFSSFIIFFVLSWLSILLYIIIKLESKGPLIFKQNRDGLNGSQFLCYKFRSMAVNKEADNKQATKGDIRVTKVGKFIRKTSIDELPQFINVFMGDMSVVGPRPHMTSQSIKYAQVVDKYFVRNLVKPGVTGLAQVRGLRGEIETDNDMEHRVRMDIFYINNWSFVLDIKIILQTVLNAVKGEEKAY